MWLGGLRGGLQLDTTACSAKGAILPTTAFAPSGQMATQWKRQKALSWERASLVAQTVKESACNTEDHCCSSLGSISGTPGAHWPLLYADTEDTSRAVNTTLSYATPGEAWPTTRREEQLLAVYVPKWSTNIHSTSPRPHLFLLLEVTKHKGPAI